MVKDAADIGDTYVKYFNPRHLVTMGGFMPNRYTEHQIPFFGFPNGYRECHPSTFVGKVDLRYCLLNKNFITVRAGFFIDTYTPKEFFTMGKFFVYGAEYARQTMVGPLRVAVQWGRLNGLSGYASVGFDF